MSHYQNFIAAAHHQKQATWNLKTALYKARKHERVPWANICAIANISRATANNWYKEIEDYENSTKQQETQLVTLDLNTLDTATRQAVLSQAQIQNSH